MMCKAEQNCKIIETLKRMLATKDLNAKDGGPLEGKVAGGTLKRASVNAAWCRGHNEERHR
jgi:hypothetical protein